MDLKYLKNKKYWSSDPKGNPKKENEITDQAYIYITIINIPRGVEGTTWKILKRVGMKPKNTARRYAVHVS